MINFKPLKRYSTVFKVYSYVRKVFYFLLVLAVLALIYLFFIKKVDLNISFSTMSPLLNPFILIFALFIPFILLMISMSAAWSAFAKANNFNLVQHISFPPKPGSPSEKMIVPSFKGKPLRVSLFPILGKINEFNFGFLTRQYKEGGIIRLRDRKMDTILWLDLPVELPHVVIDSRLNERARLSNLSKHYDISQLLHFEGVTGDRYFVYTAKGNEVGALQLFTPDVLEVLFSQMPLLDIEVKGKTIWFIRRYGVLDDKLGQEIFNAVEAFMSEFKKQMLTASFTDEEINRELV